MIQEKIQLQQQPFFMIYYLENGTRLKRYVEDRAGMFERVKYENPKIGENFYVFKNLINKEL